MKKIILILSLISFINTALAADKVVSDGVITEDGSKVYNTQYLSGDQVIELLKKQVYGQQVVDGVYPDDCKVNLLIAVDNKMAELVFVDDKTNKPLQYTLANSKNSGRFWFASGVRYEYVKTDVAFLEEENFYVRHTYNPVGNKNLKVTIYEEGDAGYTLRINKDNSEVSPESLCQLDY